MDQRWKSLFGISDIAQEFLFKHGIMDGAGGLIKGIFSGVIGRVPKFNGGPIKRMTTGLGWGVGGILRGLGKGTFFAGLGIARMMPSAFKSAIKDFNWTSKLVGKTFDNISTKVAKDTINNGTKGIAGRIMKPSVSNAIALGAIGLGVMNGVEKADYNMGLRTLTNGMMDTEGVTITPGQVSPNFTPVTVKRANRSGLRDMGVSGEIGFALHNQRNNLM